MKHLTSEELVLVYYGEQDGAHLSDCEECRAAFERLEADLAAVSNLPVPERGEEYGREVWARIAPLLDQPRAPGWQWLLAPRRWAIAGAMAVLIAGAFLAGRFWPAAPANAPQPVAAHTRERILLVAVGDHLERSQMVLLEIVNAQPGAAVNIASEQRRADDLVAENRLYRQTAAFAGETGIAEVLDDLERVLLEIARGPSQLTGKQLDDLRQRIQQQGIVFKVRVIDSKLQTRSSAL